MAKGTVERKCLKGHNKADGRCSAACLRWYPRIGHPTPDGDGRRRRFDYLGGYPTKAAAQSALDQACRRRHDDHAADRSTTRRRRRAVTSGPTAAHPAVNELLDHWLSHLQTKGAIRLRTLGRYRQLLEHHVRPYLGTLPLSTLSTLQIQRLYDHLAHQGRKDGKPGGLHPRTIRELHHCLHQALTYARRWHHLPTNPADGAEPPALPTHSISSLTPEQVRHLLAAAQQDPRPWLRAFVVLAAATGARNGELCGLEWHDLDLEAGTIRFRQALSSVDQQLATGQPRPDGARGKLLVVGPLKTPASQAVLHLPAFAVAALRDYQHQQPRTGTADGPSARLRLLHVQPGQPPRPVEPDLVLRTQWGTPLRPNHASRAFRTLAEATEIAAHPHLLRHSLASALAAAKEPASVIAEQLRHADGGTLASRTYLHPPASPDRTPVGQAHPGGLRPSSNAGEARR
jgi:integrase